MFMKTVKECKEAGSDPEKKQAIDKSFNTWMVCPFAENSNGSKKTNDAMDVLTNHTWDKAHSDKQKKKCNNAGEQ